MSLQAILDRIKGMKGEADVRARLEDVSTTRVGHAAALTRAELEHAVLSKTTLISADLSSARLFGATFDGANLAEANFDGEE